LAAAVVLLAGPALASPHDQHPTATATATFVARLRPVDPDARALLETALDSSPTVAELAVRLEQTDIIAIVETRVMEGSARAITVFFTAAPGARYLLIRINRMLDRASRIEMVGHELQHALEVAAAPEVRDEAGMATLYRRIGRPSLSPPGFETEAAKEAGKRVRADLKVSARLASR
jgi:hypothetical protein